MIPADDDVLPALLEALILGSGETPLWSSFIDLLRARLRADYTSIVFRPFDPGTPLPRVVHLFSGAGSPPFVSRLYRESLHRSDPLPYDAMVPGRVYALPELLDGSDPRHEAYRLELLVPSGMNRLRMMRIEEPGGTSAWLTASRRLGDFAPADAALMATLAPYIRAALTSHVARERERTQAWVAGEAIRRMNFAWLTLDGGGHVIDADANAEAILADPALDLARNRDGRLVAQRDSVRQAIDDTLATTGRPARRARAVVLSRHPWLDMLFVPVAHRLTDARRAPSAILYLHADRWTNADHIEHLHALFGLTPSEAGLALALSRGLSIAEAAVELKLSVGSARTYSKRIYSKTGARGQSDLIRFIHRSVMVLT